MGFRQDINALRALAVALVVLFHFKVPGFAGGFIGVDVFFVISGYLMTGIIVKGLERRSFSFLEFYQARARRIVPALAALCTLLLLLGYFYLPTDDYRALIREIKSSLLFYSNIELASSSGYFDTPASEHWLLHTWSLSVEWQFYLVFPVFLYGLHRALGQSRLLVGVLVATLLSYVWSIYLTPLSSASAFYLLPSRAFELLAGAVVYLTQKNNPRKGQGLMVIMGTTLILACGTLLDSRYAWPGALALLPVLGTALVIFAATELKGFALAPVRHLGEISYSVYLWHWPVVVLLYFCGLLSSLKWVALGVLVSLLLGHLSYKLIELRFKRATSPAMSLAKYFTVTVMLVAVAASLSSVVKRHPELRPAVLQQGQPKYTSSLYQQQCKQNPYGAADCTLANGDIKVVLFGDSHAQSNAAAVQLNNNGAALGWALGGCPLLLDFEMRDKDRENKCKAFNREKLAILESQLQGTPVVLFNHYALYLDVTKSSSSYVSAVKQSGVWPLKEAYAEQFRDLVCRIAKHHPVYLVKPTPEMPFSVFKSMVLQQRLFGSHHDFSIPLTDHARQSADADYIIEGAAQACNAHVIDPALRLCPNGRCLGTHNGIPLYFDDNHLVDAGNLLMRDLFRTVFEPQGSTSQD
ncbi:acyltransferase family protein [Metapseudomonas otitidis]|jgi:peptidoglycan/LPS O-acetylase OafA/YrhL